jgi:hypothetical protein
VEALWSQFENVMGTEESVQQIQQQQEGHSGDEDVKQEEGEDEGIVEGIKEDGDR